jgi:hypothetical protein
VLFNRDKVGAAILVVEETWHPQHARHIHSRWIGSCVACKSPLQLFGLLFFKSLDLPNDLPFVRRTVDQIIRLRQVLSPQQALHGGSTVFVEIQVYVLNAVNIFLGSTGRTWF